MNRSLLVALVAAAALLAVRGPAEAEAGTTTLDLRTGPLPDFYFTVRALAAGKDSAAVPEALIQAVSAARALDAALPGPRAWALLDGQAARCRTALDLSAACSRIPDPFVMSTGDTLRVQVEAMALAKRLEAAEPWFLEVLWPEHEKRLAEANADLQKTLIPHQDECYRRITEALDMKDPGRPVPVVLVAQAPPPGAVTVRAPGGPICFVGVSDLHGSTLAEVVLHESIHALDAATSQEATLLRRLRDALAAAGVPDSDRRFRNLPHAVIFLQAAATVRAVLDPEYEDYGKTHHAYERMPEAVAAVASVWPERLQGKITAEDAVRRIVENATGPRR